MKQYYILKESQYGGYPKVDCLTIFQAQLIDSRKIYSGIKPTLKFQLKRKNGRMTDVLSTTAGPTTDFLISERLKNIIDRANIMRHQYFDALVINANDEYTYHWLHLSQPELINGLDYKKSIFYQAEWGFDNKKPITIESYGHYESLKTKDNDGSFCVGLDKIVLADTFDRSLDMFFLLPFDSNVYVSEELKCKIEENKITGIEFSAPILL